MKAIKTLLAVSVLAAAGAANAALFDITLAASSTQFPAPISNAVINDTGTYDSTAGTGSVHGTIALTIGPSVYTVTENNAITMNTATGTGTYFAGTGCTDDAPGFSNGQLCAGLNPAFRGNLTSTTPVTGAGTYEWDMEVLYIDSNHDPASVIVPYAVTLFTPAAVPVPAAAWLFGSGLLGLVGTARRRRYVAAV